MLCHLVEQVVVHLAEVGNVVQCKPTSSIDCIG